MGWNCRWISRIYLFSRFTSSSKPGSWLIQNISPDTSCCNNFTVSPYLVCLSSKSVSLCAIGRNQFIGYPIAIRVLHTNQIFSEFKVYAVENICLPPPSKYHFCNLMFGCINTLTLEEDFRLSVAGTFPQAKLFNILSSFDYIIYSFFRVNGALSRVDS